MKNSLDLQAMNHEHDDQTFERLMGHLPRVHAPNDFEQTSFVRLLLNNLPRATAPIDFEEEIMARIAREEKGPIRRPLRWSFQNRHLFLGIAVGAALAILGGIAYYILSQQGHDMQVQDNPTQEVLIVPVDSNIEKRLTPTPVRLKPAGKRHAPVRTESDIREKRVAPGSKDHPDEE